MTGWEESELQEDPWPTLEAYMQKRQGGKAKEYFSNLLHGRSRLSFLNSIAVADQLYSQGAIETKNTAVVIGTGHLPDIYGYVSTKDLVDRFPHVCTLLTDNLGSPSH